MKRLAACLVGATLVVGVALINPPPVLASDSGAGAERPVPDEQGHKAYCNVAGPGIGLERAPNSLWTWDVKCQYGPTNLYPRAAFTAARLWGKLTKRLDNGTVTTSENAEITGFGAGGSVAAGGKYHGGIAGWNAYPTHSGCSVAGGCWTKIEGPFSVDVTLASGSTSGTLAAQYETGTFRGAAFEDNRVSVTVTSDSDTAMMPYDYFTGGSAGDPPPVYCDVTSVVGDTSAKVAKDPAQTYRYEVHFAGRDGNTAAPDKIHFGASWQENVEAAKVPYANITTVSAGAVKAPSSFKTAEWATPPAASPLVIDVVFPEAKVYALSLWCVSDDGHASAWVGGDLLPDPETGEIATDLHTQKLQECVPSGWGLLNPTAYARVTGCVFRYLFVPWDPISEHWAEVQAANKGSAFDGAGTVVTNVVGAPVAFLSAANGGSHGCQGVPMNLTQLSPELGTIYPFDACDGTGKTMAGWLKLFLTFGLLYGGASVLAGLILPLFGMKPPPKDGQLSFADGTPVPKDWR